MFATLRVTAEILSTFTCTSRHPLRCQTKLLATHFQPSHAAFCRTNPRKIRGLTLLLNAPDPRSKIHLQAIPWEVVYAPLRVLLPRLQENVHEDLNARRL